MIYAVAYYYVKGNHECSGSKSAAVCTYRLVYTFHTTMGTETF